MPPLHYQYEQGLQLSKVCRVLACGATIYIYACYYISGSEIICTANILLYYDQLYSKDLLVICCINDLKSQVAWGRLESGPEKRKHCRLRDVNRVVRKRENIAGYLTTVRLKKCGCADSGKGGGRVRETLQLARRGVVAGSLHVRLRLDRAAAAARDAGASPTSDFSRRRGLLGQCKVVRGGMNNGPWAMTHQVLVGTILGLRRLQLHINMGRDAIVDSYCRVAQDCRAADVKIYIYSHGAPEATRP